MTVTRREPDTMTTAATTGTAGRAPLRQWPAWKALEAHYQKIRDLHLHALFAEDP